MKLLIRWLVTSAALFAAAYLVPGIRVEDPEAWKVYVIMALVLGLVNAWCGRLSVYPAIDSS
jgi:uncharacterized membrane protein YvlD (DUF360 family)